LSNIKAEVTRLKPPDELTRLTEKFIIIIAVKKEKRKESDTAKRVVIALADTKVELVNRRGEHFVATNRNRLKLRSRIL
jgi:hypothetical protein